MTPTRQQRAAEREEQRGGDAWAAGFTIGAYLALPEAERAALPAGLREAFQQALWSHPGGLLRTALTIGARFTMTPDQQAPIDDWWRTQDQGGELSPADWPGWAAILGDAWHRARPRRSSQGGNGATTT